MWAPFPGAELGRNELAGRLAFHCCCWFFEQGREYRSAFVSKGNVSLNLLCQFWHLPGRSVKPYWLLSVSLSPAPPAAVCLPSLRICREIDVFLYFVGGNLGDVQVAGLYRSGSWLLALGAPCALPLRSTVRQSYAEHKDTMPESAPTDVYPAWRKWVLAAASCPCQHRTLPSFSMLTMQISARWYLTVMFDSLLFLFNFIEAYFTYTKNHQF